MGWDHRTTIQAIKNLSKECTEVKALADDSFIDEKRQIESGFAVEVQSKAKIKTTDNAGWTFEEDAWRFMLGDFPGCCGIGVSFHTNIHKTLRNNGLGKLLHRLKEAIARRLKFGLLLATVTDDNKAQIRVLLDTGWHQIDSFVNPKTHNRVLLFSKHFD